jgi:hypothetical protein
VLCYLHMELRASLYAWRGCAITTVMLMGLCMPACRDIVHFRCVSGRHLGNQPHEFAIGDGKFIDGVWGCRACVDACVLALSASNVGGVDL